MMNLYVSILSMVLAAGVQGDQPPVYEAAARTDGIRQITNQVFDCRLKDGSALAQAIVSPSVDLRLRQLIVGRCNVSDVGTVRQLREDAPTESRRVACVMVQLTTDEFLQSLGESKEDVALKKIWDRLEHQSFVALGVADRESQPVKLKPPGWETVTSNGTSMALDIARDDALRQLTAACDRAFDGDARNDDYRTHMAAIRTAVETASPQFHGCQVCTVTVPYEIKDVLFNAVGYGIPPWSHVRNPSECTNRLAPSWSSQTLVATGRGGLTGADPGGARAVARSAAKADAFLKLAKRVDELPSPFQGTFTMGQWLRTRTEYNPLWAAFLHTAHTLKISESDDVYAIECRLDLGSFWSLVCSVEYAENRGPQLKVANVR